MTYELFWKSIRASIFNGKISQSQKEGIDTIINESYVRKVLPAQLAYILATAHHETGGTMLPVREGFAKTDQQAVDIVTRMWRNGRISKNYAERASNGNSYYGRGYVQLTWEHNYQKASDKLNVDFHGNPDFALVPHYAAEILVTGMMDGWFTGVPLTRYVNEIETNFKQARRVVNGLDRADKIADTAQSFLQAINYAIKGVDL